MGPARIAAAGAVAVFAVTITAFGGSELTQPPTQASSGQGRRVLAESREGELERKIGQMTMENDFLKKLLRSFEEQQVAVNGGGPSTRRSARKKSP